MTDRNTGPPLMKKKKPAAPNCPKCGNLSAIKNGFIQATQRWKCKKCYYQYTRVVRRGRPIWQKSLAVLLYSNNVSLYTIAEILKIQPSTVLKWVRLFSSDFVPTQGAAGVRMLEIKQMRRYLDTSKGKGMLCIAINAATFKKNIGITIDS